MRCRSIVVAAACVWATVPCGATMRTIGWAQSPAVGRVTTHASSDLIDALIAQGRHQDAKQICIDAVAAAAPGSPAAAWWAVKLSESLALIQRGAPEFDDDALALIDRPVVESLSAYPDQPYRWMLSAQAARNQLSAAADDVTRIAVTPRAERLIDRALKRLLAFENRSGGLRRDLATELARLRQTAAQNDDAGDPRRMIEDLVRLDQELMLAEVRAAVLKTDIFRDAADADELVAAAAIAIEVAERAVKELPADTSASGAAIVWLVAAIDRAGRPRDALQRWIELARSEAELDRRVRRDPDAAALWVRLQLTIDRSDEARRALQMHYREPASASASLMLDLSRLRWLIASGADPSQCLVWIDAIAGRHGDHAKRLAEAIMIGPVPPGGDRDADAGRPDVDVDVDVDARLLAMRGRQRLREGATAEAFALLRSAAVAADDPQQASAVAIEAAAVADRSNDPTAAAEILLQTARRFPAHPPAAALHLQSTVLAAADEAMPLSHAALWDRLRECVLTWPDTPSAGAALRWAIEAAARRQDPAAAIGALRWTPPGSWTEADVSAALRSAQSSDRDDAVIQAVTSWLTAAVDDAQSPAAAVAAMLRTAAVVWLDVSDLEAVSRPRPGRSPWLNLNPAAKASGSDDAAALDAAMSAIATFRLGRADATLRWPSIDFADDLRRQLTWRLMRDGRTDGRRAAQIAAALDRLPGIDTTDADAAERLIWQSRFGQAESEYERLIARSQTPGTLLSQAADAFARSDAPQSQRIAIKLYDRLAGGVPRGGDRWHAAKLSAIESLRRLGDVAQAEQRSRYVLLTAAPTDPELRRRYQAALSP